MLEVNCDLSELFEAFKSRILARICNLGVQSVNLTYSACSQLYKAHKHQKILNIVSIGNAFLAIPENKCPNSEIAR